MELSTVTHDELHQMFYSDLMKITQKFSLLQTTVRENITDHRKLVATVLDMQILSETKEKEVKEACNTTEVWIVLSGKFWSFLDYGKLKVIIENNCGEREKEMMKEYEEEVKRFCSRRVSNILSQISTSDHSEMEEVHVTLDLSNPILNHIKDLKIVIANILFPGQAMASKLVLHDIKSGSVVVSFLVMSSVVHFFEKMKLTEEQRDALKKAHVLSIKFKTCKVIFNAQSVEEKGGFRKLIFS